MAKKLTLPLAALAVVLALLVPATAAAEDVLLPVGTLIKISTKGTQKITSSKIGTIECSEATWEGTLTENGGKLLISKMEGFGIKCTHAGAEVKVTTRIEPTKIAESEAEKGTGTLSWIFSVKLSESLTCNYSGSGTFTWTKGTDNSGFNQTTLSVTPAACGTSATLDAVESTDQYKEGAEWKPVKWL